MSTALVILIAVESIPVLGQIVSLFEMVIAKCCCKPRCLDEDLSKRKITLKPAEDTPKIALDALRVNREEENNKIEMSEKTPVNSHPASESAPNATLEKELSLQAVLQKDPVDCFAVWRNLRKEREFLRRIPLGEWNNFIEKIGKLDRDSLSLEAIDAFQLGKWEHPIFKHPEWPLLAFYAYLEGLLEEKYLPKLILFDACCAEASADYGVRTFQLIDRKGNIDHTALKIIQEGMKESSSEQCIQDLVEKLRKSPPEMSQFFQIQQRKEASETFYNLTRTGFHPFLYEDDNENYIQTVLPPEFVHEILQARFGETTRMPNPVLGYFKKEKMSLVDRRVVSLSLRDHIKLPQQLHDFSSTPLGYYQHDAIYHLFVDSANMHRAAWIEIAKLFKDAEESDIAERIFDGDFPPYRSAIHVTPQAESLCGKRLEKNDELFWGSLIAGALINFRDDPEKAVDLFWNYLETHSLEWNQNYGLSIESLRQFLLEMSVRIMPPNKLGLSLRDGDHILRLLAKKAGLQKEFKLWEGFPSFEKRRELEAQAAKLEFEAWKAALDLRYPTPTAPC